MKNDFKINDPVIRVGSSKDYTTGRIGYVVAKSSLPENGFYRYQVRWILEASGSAVNSKNPNNGVKTWVNGRFLNLTESARQSYEAE
jgi:hypothetical protein